MAKKPAATAASTKRTQTTPAPPPGVPAKTKAKPATTLAAALKKGEYLLPLSMVDTERITERFPAADFDTACPYEDCPEAKKDAPFLSVVNHGMKAHEWDKDDATEWVEMMEV